METLLDILVYDGFCEKIDVMKPNIDGIVDSEEEEDDEEPEPRRVGSKRKSASSKNAAKRRRVMDPDLDDSDEDEGGEEEEDFELPPPLDGGKGAAAPSKTKGSKLDRLRKRPRTYVVYRCIPNYKRSVGLRLGLTDAPCGICPVSQLCENRGKPKVLDSPAPVTVVSSVGKEKRQREWIQMKAPGGDDMGHAGDGRWRGGGTKNDAEVPGPINPSSCAHVIFVCRFE
jgi:DNA-directed RNA polymerase III subunit RPC6